MAKARTVYRCQSCGYLYPKMLGRCAECGEQRRQPVLLRCHFHASLSPGLCPFHADRSVGEQLGHEAGVAQQDPQSLVDEVFTLQGAGRDLAELAGREQDGHLCLAGEFDQRPVGALRRNLEDHPVSGVAGEEQTEKNQRVPCLIPVLPPARLRLPAATRTACSSTYGQQTQGFPPVPGKVRQRAGRPPRWTRSPSRRTSMGKLACKASTSPSMSPVRK